MSKQNQLKQKILREDLITVFDPKLDNSNNTPETQFATCILQISAGTHIHTIIYVWHSCNVGSRYYSYYSTHHNTHSHIDFLLTSPNWSQVIVDSNIGSISASHYIPMMQIYEAQQISSAWIINIIFGGGGEEDKTHANIFIIWN